MRNSIGIDAEPAGASTEVGDTEVPTVAPRDVRLLVGLRQQDGMWTVSTVEVAPRPTPS